MPQEAETEPEQGETTKLTWSGTFECLSVPCVAVLYSIKWSPKPPELGLEGGKNTQVFKDAPLCWRWERELEKLL